MGGSAGTSFGLGMVVTVSSFAIVVARWAFSILASGDTGEKGKYADRKESTCESF